MPCELAMWLGNLPGSLWITGRMVIGWSLDAFGPQRSWDDVMSFTEHRTSRPDVTAQRSNMIQLGNAWVDLETGKLQQQDCLL
eukprot:s3374_g6.t1